MHSPRPRRIAVFGAGAWGTALAQAFSATHEVCLWGRDRAHLDEVMKRLGEAGFTAWLPGRR